jgi:hypothetical protein
MIVEDAGDAVMLRRAARFPATRLDEVAGCLRSKGKPKTLAQMNAAIGREALERHDRGRDGPPELLKSAP